VEQRIYLSPPAVLGDEEASLVAALRSNWIAPLGPEVDAFERDLEQETGVGHALATSSGTAAIHLALLALGGQTTLNGLFAALRTALSAQGVECGTIEPLYEDFRPGDIRHSLADISNATADFGYAPETTLDDGLIQAVAE
jgi:dTDP-4-amino-4,6-dideoxygalactose transaminase